MTSVKHRTRPPHTRYSQPQRLINSPEENRSGHAYAATFLGVVAFFFGAAFLVVAGAALVLVTRPDLVLLMTAGLSTMAGAYGRVRMRQWKWIDDENLQLWEQQPSLA